MNRKVFNVAQFADFEVNPIHIPNQVKVSRLPSAVTSVAAPVATAKGRIDPPRMPPARPIIRPTSTSEKTEAITCTPTIKAPGSANTHKTPRKWPLIISPPPTGAKNSTSNKPPRRASKKNRHDGEAAQKKKTAMNSGPIRRHIVQASRGI